MISETLAAFMGGPLVSTIATRDRENRPAAHRCFGLEVSNDRRVVRALVAERFMSMLAQNAADNRRAALLFGDPVSHEAYQLKGEILEIRPPEEEEVARGRSRLARLGDHMEKHLNEPASVYSGLPLVPCAVVELLVTEIFRQTPGPGAGDRIAAEAAR